jgi:pantetheine-phosphate adenylyltransferase
MSHRAVYPGSFDPVTLGHLDLIQRGSRLFDHLVVAIGRNSEKTALFPPEERVAMIRAETGGLKNVEVATFDGLVVDFAKARGLDVILRGLRTVSDFETEFQMALTNRTYGPGIETVFVLPGERFQFVSSRLIKEVASAGGDVRPFVPEAVARALERRFSAR